MDDLVVCDVCVSINSTVLDEEILDLWLDGYTWEEAIAQLIKRGVLQEMLVADEDCVRSEVNDNYRLFGLLEKFLENPPKILEQCHLNLETDTSQMLIAKYYEIDESVVREMLGKKLSSKTRKDLDDVADKTRVRLKSCRRQFDNFRRICKNVEEMKGSLVANIQHLFLLSEPLARKYAAMVFLANNRFETNKRRLAYLTFDDLIFCADQMISHWSYRSKDLLENMEVDIDREFLHSLRDLKILLDKEHVDELRGQVIKKLGKGISEKSRLDLESNFRTIFRVLINIAVDLNHSRDLRDFFVDIVEKFIEPCKNARYSVVDVDRFLSAINESIRKYDAIKRNQPSLLSSWERYCKVLNALVVDSAICKTRHFTESTERQLIVKLLLSYLVGSFNDLQMNFEFYDDDFDECRFEVSTPTDEGPSRRSDAQNRTEELINRMRDAIRRKSQLEAELKVQTEILEQVAIASHLKLELERCSSRSDPNIRCRVSLRRFTNSSAVQVQLDNGSHFFLLDWTLVCQFKQLRRIGNPNLTLTAPIHKLEPRNQLNLDILVEDSTLDCPLLISCFLTRELSYTNDRGNKISRLISINLHRCLLDELSSVRSKDEIFLAPKPTVMDWFSSKFLSGTRKIESVAGVASFSLTFGLSFIHLLRIPFDNHLQQNFVSWLIPSVKEQSGATKDSTLSYSLVVDSCNRLVVSLKCSGKAISVQFESFGPGAIRLTSKLQCAVHKRILETFKHMQRCEKNVTFDTEGLKRSLKHFQTSVLIEDHTVNRRKIVESELIIV